MATHEYTGARRRAYREPGARRRPAPPPTAGRRRRTRTTLLTLALLAVVLIVGSTPAAAPLVERLRAFLEFYVGVFTLLAATAAVVAGIAAAQRILPIGLRILAQAAHRATAVMAVGFLVTHIVLKVMEAHASVLDAFVPLGGSHGLYVGLGTIAGDLLVLVTATGVLRGRFVGNPRPWLWRTIHALAYVMWPVAIVHGLLAGRAPKAWVTISYLVCLGLVAVAATGRLPRPARDRRMLRARKARGDGRVTAGATGSRRSSEDARSRGTATGRVRGSTGSEDLPDEEFWAALRAETAPWLGDRR